MDEPHEHSATCLCSEGHIITGPFFDKEHGHLVIPCRREVLIADHRVAIRAMMVGLGMMLVLAIGNLLGLSYLSEGSTLGNFVLTASVVGVFGGLWFLKRSGPAAMFVNVSPAALRDLKVRRDGFKTYRVRFGGEVITAVLNVEDFRSARQLAAETGFPDRRPAP